jgi:hypothetical protein
MRGILRERGSLTIFYPILLAIYVRLPLSRRKEGRGVG